MQIRAYEPADAQALIDLWTEVLPDAAPHNDPRASLESKLKTGDGLLLVATLEGQVVGTVMGGFDGHRGWVYSLAVFPDVRRRGIGTALCQKLMQMLRDRGCLKLNLQVRSDNSDVIAFYEKLGFAIEQRASLGKRLYD
jgi:ribosomal protein S18 acetylase RimI-like enzyme